MSATLRIIILVFVAVSLSFTALSQQPASDGSGRDKIMAELKPYKHKFFVKELKLTKEQSRDFLPLYDEMYDRIQEAGNDCRRAETSVMNNAEATDAEIIAAARTLFEQKAREGRIETEYFDRFSTILTPGQLLMLKSVERRFNQSLMRHHRKLSKDKNEAPDRQ